MGSSSTGASDRIISGVSGPIPRSREQPRAITREAGAFFTSKILVQYINSRGIVRSLRHLFWHSLQPVLDFFLAQ